jgi:hypothetical protein
MARSRAITEQKARQILAVLITERKITERDARLALARHRRRVEQLRRELRALEGGDVPSARLRPPETKVRRVPRAKPASAKRRKAMRQQGLYLAAVRPLRPQDRAKVKTIRTEKGFAAAIAEARRLGS